jgi:hypothetical protein
LKAKLLLRRIARDRANVHFRDAVALAEALGFRLSSVAGSHHIFAHPGVPKLLNLQDVRGEAKPYQLKQLLDLVERYNLSLGGDE